MTIGPLRNLSVGRNPILSAYGTSLLGIVSGLVTNLWLLRQVTQVVSAVDFGIYAFVLQITSYLAMLQLGLDFAASQRIAESLGRNDSSTARSTFLHVARFNRYAVFAVAIGTAAIAVALTKGPGMEAVSARKLALPIALLTGGGQACYFLARPFAAALIGSRRQHIVNLIVVGSTISTSLFAFVLLKAGLGVLCIPIASFVFFAVGVFVYRQQARRLCGFLKAEPATHSSETFKSLLAFGGLTSMGGIAWTIEATCDVVILGALFGPSVVGIYVLWWRFPSMLFDLCTRLSTSAFPVFAERHGQSVGEARQLLGKVGQLSIGLATLALLGISLWLTNFMKLWLGPGFQLPNGATIALAMGVLVCLRTFGNLAGMFWLSSGSAQAPTLVSWLQAAVKVGVGVVLARKYGILGLMLASCISSTLQIGILGSLLYGRKLVSAGLLINAFVMVTLSLALSVFGRALGFFSLSLPRFSAGVLLTVVVWAGIWFVLAWHTDLKNNLVRLIRPLELRA